MNILKRIKKICILNVINLFFSGTRFFGIKRMLLNKCEGVSVGAGTKIVTPLHIPIWSNLKIGNNVWLGRDFTLEGNGTVIIEDNCDFGPMVTCVTGTHEIGNGTRRAGEGYNSTISIGKGVWVGTRAILLPEISIDNASIIGAAAVVTKKVEKNELWGGNPAKMIKRLDD